jgi:ATP phosphoribosyltransferase regulatory subunit
LSIIKNTDDGGNGIRKMYYRENVYRPGKGDQGFREIPQLGLECMGDVDNYCILEVLLLAVKSLRQVSECCVLDISHMGLLSRLLDSCGLTGSAGREALKAIGSKNAHELRRICEDNGAPWQALVQMAQLCGEPGTVLPQLETIFGDAPELVQFKALLAALENMGIDCINVDFSVVNDMNYYNGIVFRGFVEGVPGGVLSGGQYDSLMEKMKRRGKAIGFALYPDLLERLVESDDSEQTDAVLLYDPDADAASVAQAISALIHDGLRVSAQPIASYSGSAKKIYRLEGNEVRCDG